MVTVKAQLERALKKAILTHWPQLAHTTLPAFAVERADEERFGDYSTAVAMKLAPLLRQDPLEIARKILSHQFGVTAVDRSAVVAPGFINFFLSGTWLGQQPASILRAGARWGELSAGRGARVLLEFISANPTGPIHVGNGRGAFWGDTLARVMTKAGFKVRREYYVNDVGKQVEILAESVTRRYLQAHGVRVDYPDYCYQGEYIKDLAHLLTIEDARLKNVVQIRNRIKSKVVALMIRQVKKLLATTLGVRFDNFFHESALYRRGMVAATERKLRDHGLVYEQEGATWLATTKFGDDKDRVLVKSGGEHTYFLPDIAYHWNKLATRRFDRAINIWGADHYGYINRLKAALAGLGFDAHRLEIIVMQFVRLIEKGREVKMSKRSGTFITLEELVRDVGLDAARYFFLTKTPETHLDFDLDLARAKSEDNPVYYIQYASARICSILEKIGGVGTKEKQTTVGLDHAAERSLVRRLVEFPEVVETVALTRNVQLLPVYAHSLARAFHNFYTQCRVLEGETVNAGRLTLVRATQVVLTSALGLMGISVPEKM